MSIASLKEEVERELVVLALADEEPRHAASTDLSHWANNNQSGPTRPFFGRTGPAQPGDLDFESAKDRARRTMLGWLVTKHLHPGDKIRVDWAPTPDPEYYGVHELQTVSSERLVFNDQEWLLKNAFMQALRSGKVSDP